LATKWPEEEDNYVTILNKESKENTGSSSQDLELMP